MDSTPYDNTMPDFLPEVVLNTYNDGRLVAYEFNHAPPRPAKPAAVERYVQPPPLPPSPPPAEPSKRTVAYPQREWRDISSHTLSSLNNTLQDLIKCCSATRKTYEAALATFELCNAQFVAKRNCPMSTEEKDDFLRVYDRVVQAGRGIFEPQQAYRNAISTLGLFVTDLIAQLPKKSGAGKRLRKEFDLGLSTANLKEGKVREEMNRLGGGLLIGTMDKSLMLYVGAAKKRLENWDEDVRMMTRCALQSIVELE